MVISHRYKYLFIETPLTGSWTIRNELCELYGGQPILHKHATWPEFQRIASPKKLGYFVFAGIRHPMDEVVSQYHKLLTDHKHVFTDGMAIERGDIEEVDRLKHRFVTVEHKTFQAYFKRFHRRPYCSMVDVSADRLDHVIRFERIQDGFNKALRHLGIRRARALPQTNRTRARSREWVQYYTPDIRDQAIRIFGPFMQEWGYAWPENWPETPVRVVDNYHYRLLQRARKHYYSRVRYNSGSIAGLIRRVRARVDR